ncbi:lysylphosphatidylglycerol synthase transmembrane domain-containing protein [Dictyobacter aurantiacus]|uniref:TIGR00374 family protein n=1 Tax=Dictyobacter aurantiacus TaxID=1936993 RepID=A0A401ZA29_9CHLR|nr:lysylphosphatidylglycerol synthase transmembrane domain-containing protein [Dictyobacter aurantiacus]GCE03673.1 TIGR00374 family protein [Dictyobacter aurantiacus]
MVRDDDEARRISQVAIDGKQTAQSTHASAIENTSDVTQSERETMGKQHVEEVSRDQLALGKRLLNWRTLVPLAFVIVALVIVALKANINPQKTWAAIRHANLIFFLCAFCIYYLSFGLRAWRWKFLLENVGFKPENGIHLPRLPKLVEIVYISFFANVVVPAKLGDLYRAYLLRQEINVSTTRSFGTVLAERLLDLIILLLLFIPAVLISLHQNMPPQIALGMKILLIAVVIGVIGLFVLRQMRESIAKLIPGRFREQYYHFQEGTLGSFRRLPQLTLLTMGVWSCEALRFLFIALALNLIDGNLIHILTASIFIGLGEALLTVIPATGGGVGLVEGGMAAMIALFYKGVDLVNQTAAAILLDRIITLFSILVFGFIVFIIAFGKKAAQKR